MPQSREEVLGRFARELEALRIKAGNPSLIEIARTTRNLDGYVNLSESALRSRLSGERPPSWEFIASFVAALRSIATGSGLPTSEASLSLDDWRNRYAALTTDLAAIPEALPGMSNQPTPNAGVSAASRTPRPPAPFIGRENERASLVSMAGSHTRVAIVSGDAGIGKTALASAFAAQEGHRFPDGTIYVALHNPNNPGSTEFNIARSTFEALGETVESTPSGSTGLPVRLRETFRTKRSLLIVDNADFFDVPEVLGLLPQALEGSECMALVLTRETVLLDGRQYVMHLRALSTQESHTFLAGIAGTARIESDLKATEVLLRSSDGNPATLQLIGALLLLSDDSPLSEVADATRGLDAAGIFSLAYYRLDDVASAALRRLALVDEGERIPDELTAYLLGDLGVDGDRVSTAVERLVEVGLLSRTAEDRALVMRPGLRDLAASRAETADGSMACAAARDRARRFFLLARGYQARPEPHISSDFWTVDDRLSHRHLADAIAEFIRHPQTQPPLTIGLKAPWGAGKTSLMRMIQENLDPGATTHPTRLRFKEPDPQDAHHRHRRPTPTGEVTNHEVLDRIKRAGPDPTAPPDDTAERTDPDVAQLSLHRDDLRWRPTVWFNPWIYQNGEQVWAGLAFEIIKQVTDRLETGDRERFWLSLNLARADLDVLRRRWYQTVVVSVLPYVAVWLAAFLAAVAAIGIGEALPALRSGLRGVSAGVLGIGTTTALAGGFGRVRSFLHQAASGSLATLVRRPNLFASARQQAGQQLQAGFNDFMPDPGYRGRVGFLHLVQTDIKRVLDTIATPVRPLVVFVDDLDRCSPGTVAQVIEALNLFLAGEFPNCVFILGMEPGAVAAHVEVAYEQLAKAENGSGSPRDGSSLGWRFLEKIVQLPLNVPTPTRADEITDFLQSLLTPTAAQTRPSGSPPPESSPTPKQRWLRMPTTAPTRALATAPTPPRTARQPSTAAPTPTQSSTQTNQPRSPERTDPQSGAATRAVIDRMMREMRAKRPTPQTLREIALAVQLEVLGRPAPLEAVTLTAADQITAALYSDVDALQALLGAVSSLESGNPREIKRYVNLFRFYSFISARRRLTTADAPSQEQIAKLAVLAIRWPHVISMTGSGGNSAAALTALERAAKGHPGEPNWDETVKQYLPSLTAPTRPEGPPTEAPWLAGLRAFLATDVEIGPIALSLV